jgi:hypothetical protein
MTRRLGAGTVPLLFALILSVPSVFASVLCTTRDGKIFAGDEPPPGCTAKGERLDASSQHSKSKTELPEPGNLPVERDGEHPVGPEAQAAEMDRRRNTPAIAMRSIANTQYANGRFVQGTVANGADFPVYGVRICADSGNVCQSIVPPTLPPGAQGTFSFPTNLLGVPDYVVTWDVVPHGTE